MNIRWAIFLGAVQGITEILPISSTAHLIIFPWFFDLPSQGLAFDVALHLGSLAAIIAAFSAEWLSLFKNGARLIKNKLKPSNHQEKMIYYLIAATLPGATAGYFFADIIENALRSPYIIVSTLIFFGLLMLLAEKYGHKQKDFSKITFKDALSVGIAQAVALIPGTSRSGITISTGLLSGLRKEEAAKFSFMLSAPVILGAAVVKLPKAEVSMFLEPYFWLGLSSALIFGLLSIKFILKFVQRYSFRPFVYYRFALAALILFFLIRR